MVREAAREDNSIRLDRSECVHTRRPVAALPSINGVGASDATDHSPDGVCAIHSSPFELPGSLADSVFQPLQSSSCLVPASRKMPPSKALIRIDRYDQGCVSRSPICRAQSSPKLSVAPEGRAKMAVRKGPAARLRDGQVQARISGQELADGIMQDGLPKSSLVRRGRTCL